MRVSPIHVRVIRLLLVTAILIVSGCGEGNTLGRRAITGSVTFQGKPLKYGAIRFEPTDLTNGVGGGGVISEGKYAIGEELGLPPGAYKVWISAGTAGPEVNLDEPPGETPKNVAADLIPPEYNVQTKLVADVPATGPAVFDFDLK